MKKILLVILLLACPRCWAMGEEASYYDQLALFDHRSQRDVPFLSMEQCDVDGIAPWIIDEENPFSQWNPSDYELRLGTPLLTPRQEDDGCELESLAMQGNVVDPHEELDIGASLSTKQKKAVAALHESSLITVKKGMKERRIARGKLWCKECGYNVWHKGNLNAHMKGKVHLRRTEQSLLDWQEHKHRCAPCKYGDWHKGHLNAHMKSKAHLRKIEQLLSSVSGQYQCPPCGYDTPLKRSWNAHERSRDHLEKTGQLLKDWRSYEYKCKTCKHGMASRLQWDTHVRSKQHVQTSKLLIENQRKSARVKEIAKA